MRRYRRGKYGHAPVHTTHTVSGPDKKSEDLANQAFIFHIQLKRKEQGRKGKQGEKNEFLYCFRLTI